MEQNKQLSWTEAFFKSPGPENLKEFFYILLKGICMGTADIIPGVSGGTIALITGIYQNLLNAIESVNSNSIKAILKFDFKTAFAVIHVRFLLALLTGIGVAILSLARIMHFLLKSYPIFTWSLFLGLIFASIIIVGKSVKNWFGSAGIAFLFGVISGFFIVGMIPVATPETWWFIFFSGMIAICAMILPGLSGAFLLLILGKYEFVTGALKNPFVLENASIILIFLAGCVVGIAGFSRVLSFMLKNYHNLTLATLTGLMAGSMRKIWPWKETLETKIIRGKVHVLREQNIFPDTFDSSFLLACVLIITGFILVMLLEKVASQKDHQY